MITFGSSIVCMDHINFERDVNLVDELGIDFLHLDVMDGSFVPRYGIYPEIVKRISQISNMKMDLHLMVNNPEFAIDQFADISNIEYISVHIEQNEKNILRIVDKIKRMDKKAGIVLNLFTPVSVLTELMKFSEIDSVMFMGIHPGVLIQQPRPETVLEKSKELMKLCSRFGELDMVQCDGGITFDTIPKLAGSGITNFVCGSSTLYKGVDLNDTWDHNSVMIKSNFDIIKSLVV